MKKGLIALTLLLFGFSVQIAQAHCEIPCGIYGDSVRVVLLKEHIQTIEKSMEQIEKLSVSESVDYNQIVRWVTNKEEHCNKIQDIATQYFMFQRVKLTDDEVKAKKNSMLLGQLHVLCVYAMKAKQSTDVDYVAKMRDVLHNFEHLYFAHEKHHH